MKQQQHCTNPPRLFFYTAVVGCYSPSRVKNRPDIFVASCKPPHELPSSQIDKPCAKPSLCLTDGKLCTWHSASGNKLMHPLLQSFEEKKYCQVISLK
jgi:hypothetical protein